MPQEDITLRELQQEVDKWIKSIGVRYFSELTNTAILMEEVGELARVMSRKYGDQSTKAGEELNLADAFRQNMQKKTQRDALRHKQNPKLQ